MRRDRGKDVMNAHGQPVMGLIGVMRRALAYWRRYWVQGVLIVLAMLLQQGFNTFLALSLKLIIDTALHARDGMLLLWILAGLAGGFIVALVANLCADYLTARVSANILNDLRLKMFSHLQRLSMEFFARAQTGNIVAHFSSDLVDIEKGLTSRLSDAVLALIALIVNVTCEFLDPVGRDGVEPGRAPRATGRAGGWRAARPPRPSDRRRAGRLHEPAVQREQGCVQPDQEGRPQPHHRDRRFAADRRPADSTPSGRRREG